MGTNKMTVQSPQMRKVASELTNLNGQFSQKIGQMDQLVAELGGMWEGDANTAFKTACTNDKAQLEIFYKTIAAYIEALQLAAATYEQAEAGAAEVAQARTYR